jgi:diguanylate cyclase (GGDEF)-like protein
MDKPINNKAKIRHTLLDLEGETQVDILFIKEEAGEVPMKLARRELHHRLRGSRGNGLYTDMLFVLTHQHFPVEVAEKHWRQILKHQDALRKILGREAGIVVAALDYLKNFRVDNRVDYVLIPEKSIWAVSEIALRDHLTSLYDKGTFQAKLETEMKRFSRYGNDISLILMDIDNFKEINDSHGHIIGDDVLSRIGELLQREFRDTEVSARIGGEEFAILLPQTCLEEAFVSAERIRKLIAEEFSDQCQVTASFGVSSCPQNASTARDLIIQADQALYQSKIAGKNQSAKAALNLIENE